VVRAREVAHVRDEAALAEEHVAGAVALVQEARLRPEAPPEVGEVHERHRRAGREADRRAGKRGDDARPERDQERQHEDPGRVLGRRREPEQRAGEEASAGREPLDREQPEQDAERLVPAERRAAGRERVEREQQRREQPDGRREEPAAEAREHEDGEHARGDRDHASRDRQQEGREGLAVDEAPEAGIEVEQRAHAADRRAGTGEHVAEEGRVDEPAHVELAVQEAAREVEVVHLVVALEGAAGHGRAVRPPAQPRGEERDRREREQDGARRRLGAPAHRART
jgi:hypothetical protein